MEHGHEPATKADIRELRGEIQEVRQELRETAAQLRAEIHEVRAEVRENAAQLRSEFQYGFDDLKETFRDGQTELLKVFYGYTQSNDVKLKDAEQTAVALRERMTAVEMRLTQVEKRVYLPPSA